ncbi:hypothetical protein ACFV2Q_35100 [Streptomyces sp. NPDC059650]|uniref:hypothetical protein n=1 Tax=Streptomyces sp. NPDC059650 TaxID=3346896 RepID=UPI0036A8C741
MRPPRLGITDRPARWRGKKRCASDCESGSVQSGPASYVTIMHPTADFQDVGEVAHRR